jgi:hypothetical protein
MLSWIILGVIVVVIVAVFVLMRSDPLAQAGRTSIEVSAFLAEHDKRSLAEALPQIEALDPDAVRAALRLRVVRRKPPVAGLVACARALSEGYEARVVLDEFILVAGLPTDTRARLEESDDALFELAQRQTLTGEPVVDGETRLDGPNAVAWLTAPERLFGARRMAIAGAGDDGLTWTEAEPEDAEPRLVAVLRQSTVSNPLGSAMLLWDGSELHEASVLRHTIMGPSTPDYTVKAPEALIAAMGLTTNERGDVELRA